MELTRHATRRSRQRAIRPALIDLALRYGRELKSFRDRVFVLDDRSLSTAPVEVQRQADRLRGLCVVLAGESVRTVRWEFSVRRRPGRLRRQRMLP
ncbi:MAG: hypothetical protein AB1758_24575 [Candidatus Eremiobacterota bacterium]